MGIRHQHVVLVLAALAAGFVPPSSAAPQPLRTLLATTKATSKSSLTTASGIAKKAAVPSAKYSYAAAFHNTYRAKQLGTPLLTYDAGLEALAQDWANRCTWAHSGRPGVGENLYTTIGTPGAAPPVATGWANAVIAWYNEIRSYRYKSPGFSEATGHFTQVVWASTTKVGCGVAKCTNRPDRLEQYIFVCNYSPQGNINSAAYFTANVKPLKSAG